MRWHMSLKLGSERSESKWGKVVDKYRTDRTENLIYKCPIFPIVYGRRFY
jgi:hypothetical protein